MTTGRARARLAVAAVAVAVAVAGLVAVSCAGGESADRRSTTVPTVPGPVIRVLGLDSPESVTIAQVYGRYLQARGYAAELEAPMASRSEALAALGRGDVDLVVDYLGRDAAVLVPDARLTAEPDQVVTVIKPALAAIGATVLDYSPAAGGDAFVVRDDSPAIKISNVKNLDYVLGAPADCERRPRCYPGLTDPDVYGIQFKAFTRIDQGPQLADALASKRVDAVMWDATAPEIEERGFKILEDDKRLFPADNLAPLLAAAASDAYGARLAADLDILSATITTDDLVAWNAATEIEGRPPADVAADWLAKKSLA